jgi:membrane protein YqaA with SNARE-associated domain
MQDCSIAGDRMTTLTAYAGLFAISFIAATIFPMQSEAGLIALIVSGKYSTVLLVAFASAGNILGSVVNWLLGMGIERFRDKPWFPVGGAAFERAQRWYQRYGKWSLLASWLPIVGDPITVIAGVMKEPLWIFLIMVTAAKTARYAVLAAITAGVIG